VNETVKSTGLNDKIFLLITAAAGLLFTVPGAAFAQENSRSDLSSHLSLIRGNEIYSGYNDVAAWRGECIAVGTGGRIDRISPSGEIITVQNVRSDDLTGLVCTDHNLIITGKNGTVLKSTDGLAFSKSEAGISGNINGVTYFHELFIAVADSGSLLVSSEGDSWKLTQLPLNGDIVSVSSTDDLCIGVTNKGEIIRSSNGYDWEIFDYNKGYEGYYKSCSFRKVLAEGRQIVVVGIHDDQSPVVLFSSLGKAWSERGVNFSYDIDSEHNVVCLPNDICYDSTEDQYLIACDHGLILFLPDCQKCNRSVRLADTDIHAVRCEGDLVLLAGRNFSYTRKLIR
jgi:hypothetical protein